MNTVCHKQLSFESLFGKQVTADFDGGNITSDAGGLLLRELDECYGLTEGVANCLDDHRHSSWVIHELKTLVKQASSPLPWAMKTTMMQRLFGATLRLRPHQAVSARHPRIWPHRPRFVGLKTM